ncbi:WG repeat-containing protein [Morganella morganii]|uniref:WG repeat-containing protein n=1 Tax=Morganella morganii TaxID=582 RepID=UPI001419E5B4|nr:WG repeat-containing protein [Morganella morganii]NIH17841.1 WG repeat-containing protein [Morganella morganii]
MKKKMIAIPALLVIAAGMAYWFFGYEEKLPEPSQKTLDYITKEFNDLTPEEAVTKIQAQKEQFDFILGIGGKDDLYSQRKTVSSEDEEYENVFSVLTPEEYKNKFNKALKEITFVQNIEHGYSTFCFDIPVMPAEKQLVVKIKKITYMDGSEEISDIKVTKADNNIKLNTQKTVKSIDANVTFRYISDLGRYHLTPDKPEISQGNYKLTLVKKDKNYLKYSLDGELNIVSENVTDKKGKILSASACSRGEIGHIEKIERFINGTGKAAEKYGKNKDELIKRVAGYYERLEQETNEPATYLVECIYHGTPESVTVYAANKQEREEQNIILTPGYTSLYPVIEDEKTQTFYIIDQNGNEMINHGKEGVYSVGNGYFFTRHTESKKDENDGEEYESTYYQIHKLDAVNKKLDYIMHANRVYSLSDDAFVVSDGNNILIFNVNYADPIVISGKNTEADIVNSYYGSFEFFYYEDNKGTHVLNDKGEEILPVSKYWLEKGGDNTVRVISRVFMDDIATKDKKIYFLNEDATIRLTLKGYDKAGEISNEMIKAERDNLYGFVDVKGNEVVAPDYQEARYFDNGYALVRKNDHWGVINKQGDVVIPFKYSHHNSMSSMNGLISYSIDDKYYTMQELLDANGVKTDKITAAEH